MHRSKLLAEIGNLSLPFGIVVVEWADRHVRAVGVMPVLARPIFAATSKVAVGVGVN